LRRHRRQAQVPRRQRGPLPQRARKTQHPVSVTGNDQKWPKTSPKIQLKLGNILPRVNNILNH
jgi:hypothetical protein